MREEEIMAAKKVALAVIKADAGDVVGHSHMYPALIERAKKEVSVLKEKGLVPSKSVLVFMADRDFFLKSVGTVKEKEIKYIKIEDTEKNDWIRTCLVQLDFSLTEKFPYILKEKEKVRKKVFGALKIARKEKVDIIVFPELSFAMEWVERVKREYNHGVIICGSFYDSTNQNLCHIIIDGKDYSYAKNHRSIFEEEIDIGMKPGNKIIIFETKYGKIAVLTCVDFDREFTRIVNNCDLIINPRYDLDKEHKFQRIADLSIDREDGSRSPTFILQINPKKTRWGSINGGRGTTIIGFEHTYRMTRYRNEGLRPKDGIKYKICEGKDETIIIADIRIGGYLPTAKRTNMDRCNWYRYESKRWRILNNKDIWNRKKIG